MRTFRSILSIHAGKKRLTKAGNIFLNRTVPQPGTSGCRTREKQELKFSMGHIFTSKKIAVPLPQGAQKSNEVRPA